MSVPSVSVIISVFGQLQYTKRCLAQLEETLAGELDYEVLIIDDASKDGTVEFLKDLGEGYRVFFNEENQGFAKNNNLVSEALTRSLSTVAKTLTSVFACPRRV